MKINRSYLIAAAFMIGLVLWFFIKTTAAGNAPAPVKTATKETPLPQVVYELREASERAKILSLYGRTEAAREVLIKAQTAGLVVDAPAREGGRISEGALVCRQDVDARQARLDQANAVLKSAQVDLTAARTLAEKGYQSTSRVTAIEAQMDGARAAITQAEIELDNVNMRAPFSGVWERQMAEIGDYLGPGQACGLLVELSPLIVTGELTEAQVGKVKIGVKVDVVLATGEHVTGRVRLIESRANASTRTFKMEAAVPNANYKLKAGVTATLKLGAGQAMAQYIPSKTLTLGESGAIGVRYLSDDNRVMFAAVTTLDEDDNGLWVTGLPDRARIIVQGQDFVSIGTKVDAHRAGQ
ncbi:MAG: efflux RND transporter periplasmic adaptor subunit [Robiginitomaculum sp.]